MKESAKRILALVLSFVMIFTSLPVIASAYGENASISGKDVLQYEDGTYKLVNTGEYHDIADEKLEIIDVEWTSSNENVATVTEKLLNEKKCTVESVMEGETTITCKATYQKYYFNWGWHKDGNSETKTYTKTVTVVPDFIMSINVGETKEISGFGSQWLYDWEFINNDVFTTNVNTTGIDKRTITGVKAGTGYFYKNGASDYLYRVDVYDPEDGIIDCGDLTVYVGENFTLKDNNKEDLNQSDFTGKKAFENEKNDMTILNKIFNFVSQMPVSVKENLADSYLNKTYYVYAATKNDKKTKHEYYLWKITVKPATKYVDIQVNIEPSDFTFDEVSTGDYEEGKIEFVEGTVYPTDASAYVKESFTDECGHFVYTLSDDSDVVKTNFDENRTMTVTVNATYKSQETPKFVVKYMCGDNEIAQSSEPAYVVDYASDDELDLELVKEEFFDDYDGYTYVSGSYDEDENVVTFNYEKNKYTVTFLDPNGKMIFVKQDAEYGDSILGIADENQVSSMVERFTGWVINGVAVTANTLVNEEVEVKATQRPLVAVKHFLAFLEEVKDLLTENVEIVENYLTYAKEEFGSKFSLADSDDSDLKVSIKYDAAKVTIHYVDENKNELKSSRNEIVRLEDCTEMTIEEAKELEYFDRRDIEDFRDEQIKGLYAYDGSASFVEISKAANQENDNLYDVYLVFKPTYDQHKVAIRYWYNDPYGKQIDLVDSDYKFTLNEKDFSIDKVEEMSDEKIPKGFVKEGKIVDKKQSGLDDWFRQQVRVEGNIVSAMPKQFALRTVWVLKNVDGVYKDFGTANGEAGSETSQKDWLNLYQDKKDSDGIFKAPNTKYEVKVINGTIVDYTGIEGWTVTNEFWPSKPNNVGLVIDNSNVIWSTRYVKDVHNFNVNGLYDADGTKDGKVKANYYIVNSDDYVIDEKGNDKSEYELYAENVEVELETGENASRIANFNAQPKQEEKMIIWKKMILEQGQYKVYGIRLNQGAIDPNVVPITVNQKLPAGLRSFTLRNLNSDLSEAIADKAKVFVDNKEEALRQADIKAGAQVIEIEADDIEDLLYDETTKVEANVITTKEITSNYFTYQFIVILEEQDLKFETVKQNKTTAELAYKQAIANAKDAVRSSYPRVNDSVFVEENATGLNDGSVAAGTYDIVVTLLTEKEKFEVKGKLEATWNSSKKNNKKKKDDILPDDLLPQGGAGIADLRSNRPDDMLTRSEFIGVLSEIFTVLDTENYKDFGDINGDANELAIKKLSSFGIVQGYCEDTFGPNDFITREQMYTFIARALKFSGKASQLTDEQIDAALSKVLDKENVADWAKDGVATSIEKELVNETEKAQDTIKRVEAADKLEKFAAILFTEEEEIK